MEVAFESLCRTCAKPTIVAVNIFRMKLVDHLRLLTSMEYKESDAYPNSICDKCHEKVLEFIGFFKMFEKSQIKLDKILGHKICKDEYLEEIYEDDDGQPFFRKHEKTLAFMIDGDNSNKIMYINQELKNNEYIAVSFLTLIIPNKYNAILINIFHNTRKFILWVVYIENLNL